LGDKIYVFDFDCTITFEHTGGCAKTRYEVSSGFILNNIKAGFAETIRHLTQRGIPVYIATYGDDSLACGLEGATAGHALISRYMEVIFGATQTYFVGPQRNPAGEIISYVNIIAKGSEDDKKFHMEIIAERERLNVGCARDMGRIIFIDDDEKNVAYFASKGCVTLDPNSAEESAGVAKSERLFLNRWKLCHPQLAAG